MLKIYTYLSLGNMAMAPWISWLLPSSLIPSQVTLPFSYFISTQALFLLMRLMSNSEPALSQFLCLENTAFRSSFAPWFLCIFQIEFKASEEAFLYHWPKISHLPNTFYGTILSYSLHSSFDYRRRFCLFVCCLISLAFQLLDCKLRELYDLAHEALQKM
jgi:hypothetical protein